MHRGAIVQHFETFGFLLGRQFEHRRIGEATDVHLAELGIVFTTHYEDAATLSHWRAIGGSEHNIVGCGDAVHLNRHAVGHDLYMYGVPLTGRIHRLLNFSRIREIDITACGISAERKCQLRTHAHCHIAAAPLKPHLEVLVFVGRSHNRLTAGKFHGIAVGVPQIQGIVVGLFLQASVLLLVLGRGKHQPTPFFSRESFSKSVGRQFGKHAIDIVDSITGIGIVAALLNIVFLHCLEDGANLVAAHLATASRSQSADC